VKFSHLYLQQAVAKKTWPLRSCVALNGMVSSLSKPIEAYRDIWLVMAAMAQAQAQAQADEIKSLRVLGSLGLSQMDRVRFAFPAARSCPTASLNERTESADAASPSLQHFCLDHAPALEHGRHSRDAHLSSAA
jgi:hypothetical protein